MPKKGTERALEIMRYCSCESKLTLFNYSHLDPTHSPKIVDGREIIYGIYTCNSCSNQITTRITTTQEETESQGDLVRELLSA